MKLDHQRNLIKIIQSIDLYVLRNNKLIATLDISDSTKPKTKQVLNQIIENGYNITLLSEIKSNVEN